MLQKVMDVQKAKNDSISTEEYLASVYSKTKKNIQRRAKQKQEVLQAKKLQDFLRQIKYLQKGGSTNDTSFPFSSFWNAADQVVLMEELNRIHPQIFSNPAFVNTTGSSYQLGAYLEQGVARVVKGMEALATGKDYSQSRASIVGGAHTQIPDLLTDANETMKEIFTNYYNYIGDELKRYSNKSKNSKDLNFIHSVQGKIDNVGLRANLIPSVELSPMAIDIVNALKGATFTDKNYISNNEIHLGQTNPFRVFMTIAPGGSDGIGRFKRMLNCFEKHPDIHSNAPIMFYRIRAIYELTGQGMKYTNEQFKYLNRQRAKFLIWNNPLGQIYVIPTSSIIDSLIDEAQEILPQGWQDALYGPITLKQKDLESLS